MSRRARYASLVNTLIRRGRWLADPRRVIQIVQDAALLAQTPLFDAHWYINRYPDIAQRGIHPILHFLQHGSAEQRDPSEHFDTAFYVRANADVRTTGINPLVHYLR